MGRAHLHRLLLALPLCVISSMIHGQATGLNITLDYGHKLVKEERGINPTATFGLGVQHDFDRRIGMGVDMFFSIGDLSDINALEFIYSAKYFTSSNDYTSFYIGSLVGVQLLSGSGSVNGISGSVDVSHIQIPDRPARWSARRA